MIHVFKEDDGYEVWIDTEADDKDGICLGSHKNRHEAIEQARHELAEHQYALDDLERDPCEEGHICGDRSEP